MYEFIRWSTVHPALVHLTLGIIPLMLLAYGAAAARRSERWTFVGDVALWSAAVATVVVVAFGIVAFLVSAWTASTRVWALLHGALGLVTLIAVLALAGYRWRRRKELPVTGRGWALGATGAFMAAVVTGYLGGELLVFHLGIAVEGAGRGALAPTLIEPDHPPENLLASMNRLRSAWASCDVTLAVSLVEHPTPERFELIAKEARRMGRLARGLVDGDAGQRLSAQDKPATGGSGAAADEAGGEAEPGHSGPPHEHHEQLPELARDLLEHSGALERAAAAQDISGVSLALGAVTHECADCHRRLRWTGQH